MAQPRNLDENEFEVAWKALPIRDRRFISALIVVADTVGDETLRYRELPTRLERTLQRADRDTLFSVIAECFYRLLDAPVMERVKRRHHRRRNRPPVRTTTKSTATTSEATTSKPTKRNSVCRPCVGRPEARRRWPE